MAAPACPFCRQRLHFEAAACTSCGHALAFDPALDGFRYLDAADGRWRAAGDGGRACAPCDNARYGVCNWLVDRAEGTAFCRACRHNHMIPDLGVPGVLERWKKIEEAKRRLMRALIRLGLPLETRAERPDALAFDFLYDPSAEQGYAPQTLTGHAGGLVTLNLIEADDVAREKMRREMGEPYRTLLGHFRHEVGHHFCFRLVVGRWLDEFRQLFGDERVDYAAALQAYYARGSQAPEGWSEHHVSQYATTHPWEDFAETWAHYLHIVDTLATIGDFGATLAPMPGAQHPSEVDFDPYRATTASLVDRWIPFAFAMNAINRAMGQPDLYPFRLAPGVVLKLDFVNRLVADAGGRRMPTQTPDLEAMIATLGHAVEMPSEG